MTRAEQEALALRELALAIEAHERAREWLAGPKPLDCYGARVEWTWGSSVAGHRELCNEVRRHVELNMPALLRLALCNLAAGVDEARARLRKLTEDA